jgi:hypothetical protein
VLLTASVVASVMAIVTVSSSETKAKTSLANGEMRKVVNSLVRMTMVVVWVASEMPVIH